MSAAHDGGKAFPNHDPTQGSEWGMTLRDYFAAKAMQIFISDGRDDVDTSRNAYAMADAMLEARK